VCVCVFMRAKSLAAGGAALVCAHMRCVLHVNRVV
jgi:hypothetical protein